MTPVSTPTMPPEVLVVVGTRPEAIKLLPVIVALRESSAMTPVVVSTGQHRRLVAEVLALGHVGIDIDLPYPEHPLGLTDVFTSVMSAFEAALTARVTATGHEVAACIVQGDTSSAAAAAIAAFHRRIPVIHVEAGLRTGDIDSPFPEELNRQLIARTAALHLAPTAEAGRNLLAEGIDAVSILVTGNTGIDALRFAMTTDLGDEPVSKVDRPLVVVTAHRREHWGAPLQRIAAAIAELARRRPEVEVVVAAHPNPAVAAVLRDHLDALPSVAVTGPMDYAHFARLLARATLVVTDSGGIQEEAPSLGTPVLVARESTERVEGVAAGTLELVGTDSRRILAAIERLLDDPLELDRRRRLPNPYGDGRAAERVVAACERLLLDEQTLTMERSA